MMHVSKPLLVKDTQPSVALIRPFCPLVVLEWSAMRDCGLLLNISGGLGKELSWVGRVVSLPADNTVWYHITEIAFVKQLASPVSTVLDPVALAQLAERWIDVGRGNNPLKFLAHSHLGINTDPSVRDEATKESFVRGVLTPPFLIRGIFAIGPTGEQVDFTVFDYERGVEFRHVPVMVTDEERREELERLVEELTFRGGDGQPGADHYTSWGTPAANRQPLGPSLRQGGSKDGHSYA